MKKMSKQSTLLFLAGTLAMSFGTMTRTFFYISENVDDFLKGFGVTIMVGAFILDRVIRSKSANRKAV
jgi:hypothetical protein